jgi:hypothetical protein
VIGVHPSDANEVAANPVGRQHTFRAAGIAVPGESVDHGLKPEWNMDASQSGGGWLRKDPSEDKIISLTPVRSCQASNSTRASP